MRNREWRSGVTLIATGPILIIMLCALRPWHGVLAADTPAPQAAQTPSAEDSVYTRAIVRSVFEQDGKRVYIRLKLIPHGKIPFSTLTYRVLDRTLIAGLSEGASVAFVAERLNGENTLTAIRPVQPCERFGKCD